MHRSIIFLSAEKTFLLFLFPIYNKGNEIMYIIHNCIMHWHYNQYRSKSILLTIVITLHWSIFLSTEKTFLLFLFPIYHIYKYVSVRNKKIVSTEIMYTTCWYYNQFIDPTRYYYFASIHHLSLGRVNFTPSSIPYLSYVYKYARYVSLRNKKIVSTEIIYTTCWHYNQSIDPTRHYYQY